MRSLWLAGILAAVVTAACVQYPTEKQEVADLRPQFSFAVADADDDLASYRIFVDGLDMGSASSYAAGKNALRVLPGIHLVKVEGRGRVVLEERIFLGDGATRTILIRKP